MKVRLISAFYRFWLVDETGSKVSPNFSWAADCVQYGKDQGWQVQVLRTIY